MKRSSQVEGIVVEYRDQLTAILGEALKSVLLYGSRARQDAVDGSDIDVLCVMRGSFNYGELTTKTSPVAARLSLQHNVVISTTFVSSEDFRNRNTPFLMNVRRESVAV